MVIALSLAGALVVFLLGAGWGAGGEREKLLTNIEMDLRWEARRQRAEGRTEGAESLDAFADTLSMPPDVQVPSAPAEVVA